MDLNNLLFRQQVSIFRASHADSDDLRLAHEAYAERCLDLIKRHRTENGKTEDPMRQPLFSPPMPRTEH